MKERGMNPAALVAALSGDFHNAILAATPGGIEAQEAQGQRDLCSSGQKLPKEMPFWQKDVTRERLAEKFGIKFGADADDLFVYAELPAGWKVVPTEHSMWSDLVDAKGRKRAAIFYKAAFYDRSANISFGTRYYVTGEYQDLRNHDNHNKRYCVIDSDSKESLFHTEWCDGLKDRAGEEAAGRAAETWARERFPEYKDVFAYWD